MANKYFDNLDIIKGLAIFLVVLGHSIQCGSGSEFYQNQSFFDDRLYMFIYSFHMPLFMMISGFLYGKVSRKRSVMMILSNRSTRLLLPIVVWETLIGVFSLLRGRGVDIIGYIYSIITGFWFLWSVWWATIVCALIETIGKTSNMRILFHMVIILFGFFTPDNLNFSLHKFMYVLFLIGYIAAKRSWDRKFDYCSNVKWKCFIGMLVFYIGLFWLFQRESYIYISGWTLLDRSDWGVILWWDIYRIIIGVIGGAAIILWIHLIAPKGKSELLKDIGKNSNGIYILQTYAVVMLMKFTAGVKPHTWLNMLEAILICAGCYIVVKVLSKFPDVSLVLFGQKTRESK